MYKHSKPLWILSFSGLTNTFSYYGTQTFLVLYLLHIFHLSQSESYLFYGGYVALIFSLPVLGGIIADRMIGHRDALIFGCVLTMCGNILLACPARPVFCLGLATVIIGSALFKSSMMYLVGDLYKAGDHHKESGFTILYLAGNLGGLIGPIVYGFTAYHIGWHWAFLSSAVFISISLCLFISCFDITTPAMHKSSKRKIFVYSLVVTGCFLLSIPFYFPGILNPLIALIFIASLSYFSLMLKKQRRADRQRLLALFVMGFFGMFYYAVGMQIGTSITLFIQEKIEAGVIRTHLPASVFSSLYTLFVIVLAPVFTYLWVFLKKRKVHLFAPQKLVMGIMLAAFGIASFAMATSSAHVLFYIVLGNILLSAGELVLAPSIYTAISDYGPAGMKSTMMGYWLLFVALGSYFSIVLARLANVLAHSVFAGVDYGGFMISAIFTIGIALILLMLIPKLNKMLLT